MPAESRSLIVTDAYRRQLAALRARADQAARRNWARITPDDLDRTFPGWATITAAAIAQLQVSAARLSAGYLAAFLTTELGRPTRPRGTTGEYVAVSRDGRPILEALTPPLFTIKQAIADGRDHPTALRLGLARATSIAGEDTLHAARATLDDLTVSEQRVVGWRRVTGGGCLACLGAATGAIQADSELLETHPGCQCSKEPVVADVEERIPRPTGADIFAAMSDSEQDSRFGLKAALIRTGQATLADAVQRDAMAVLPDGITEAPLKALI